MKIAPLKSAILLLSLIFNSCSRVVPDPSQQRFPATTSVDVTPISTGGCFQLINGFLPPADEIWYQLSSHPRNIMAYSRQFRDTPLNQFERDWLLTHVKDLPDDQEIRRKIRSAFFYARTLSDRQRKDFYEHLSPWVQSGQQNHSLTMAKFLRHYKRVTKFEKQMYELEMKKLHHLLEDARALRASKVAYEKARLYERNYYRCMNAVADPSQVTKEGLKRANTVALGITFGGAGSALMTYGATNYDKEMDAEWWGEIAFVIVTSMAMGYVNSKWILANPRLKLWTQRFPLVMGAAAIQDIGITALWTELLGKEPPGEEEIKKLLTDEKFLEKMEAFVQWLETQVDYEEHFEKISALFQFSQVDKEGEPHLMDNSLTKLDPEEIDLEETLAHLVRALSDYDYEKNKGKFSLGSEDYDRYAFHRGMDLIYQPAFIVASQLMYGSLCANANPKVAIVKAISLFMAINLAADGLYFVSRRELINQ